MQTAYKSIRLFKSPLLEKISHIHPLTPLVVWSPVIAWLLWRAINNPDLSGYAMGFSALAGLLVWTFAEYILHRFVFHFRVHGEFQERIQFIMHGIHHTDPVDPTRLVMPPLVAVAMALPLFELFRLILGPARVEPFFAIFLVGYLCYDYIHYAVHHFTPRSRYGKMLKQSHMLHHYVNSEIRWGVSSPLWDYVFGTFDEPVPVKRGNRAAISSLSGGKVKLSRVRHGS